MPVRALRARLPLAALSTVVSAATALALVAAPAYAQTGGPGGTFRDDDGSVHEGWIEAIVAEGITQGCAAGPRAYCPLTSVSRAQMASFLARALDLPPAGTDYFTDDATSVHQDNINRIAAAGITLGDGQGHYLPDRPVTRDQMASFLVRGFDLPASSTDRFTDDEQNTHEDDINAVAAAGITSGCGTARYCPTLPVPRAQMAAFLGRSLGLTEVRVPPVHQLPAGDVTVGSAAPAGTYRNSASDPTSGCYWDRRDGGQVQGSDLITTGRVLATIVSTDDVFHSDGCGTWTDDLYPITSSPTADVVDGTYLVGPEVAAGTWTNSGAQQCYWARLSGFTGNTDDIIDNAVVDGPATVTLASTDKGFQSVNCGTWHRTG